VQKIKILFVFVIVALFGSGCATGARRTGPDAWVDATIIAEQQAEIQQLRRDLTDLGQSIADVSGGIGRITDGLIGSLARCRTIEDVFDAIDAFVGELIDENRKLRALQPADQPADAGTR